MWTLILTIFASGGVGGNAITNAPGFTTQQACMAAGAAWLKQANETTSTSNRAMCVKTS